MSTVPPPCLHIMASVFGILGTVGSFLVYLAPIPTFYWIYKKKSTFQFPSLPYSVALFSAMLTLYYVFLKKNSMIIMVINGVGILIESIYLIMFLIYTPSKSKIYTAKFFGCFNVLGFGVVVLSTIFIPNDALKLQLVGWACIVFSVGVYAAPLIVLKDVIKTKSTEFMSFSLSLSLTLCAILWFFHGLLIKDIFIAAPNVLGFIFGVVQMLMFVIYRKTTKSRLCLPEYSVNSTSAGAAPVNPDMKLAMAVLDIHTQIEKKIKDAKMSSDECDVITTGRHLELEDQLQVKSTSTT